MILKRWILLSMLLVLPAAFSCKSKPLQHLDQENVRHMEKPAPEAVKASKRFQHGSLKLQTYASEPLLGNPVAFDVDHKGRLYVVETYRFNAGVTDNRDHSYWLLDDLAATSVEDRLEKFQKWADRPKGKHDLSWYTRHADRVRRLIDTDDDGQAEWSNVFAGGFNGTLHGLAAGILPYRNRFYFTNIPHFWILKDPDADGQAEVRKKRHSGFGPRSSLLGHDLHGPTLGPDGRIYFSIGDRGYNVKTDDGQRLKDDIDVGRGAVFRCEPDGSNLEVVHEGLRNPQELAFDKYGNLFSVDNNSDAGDKSRLVYVVDGGDSGWTMPFQSMTGDFYNPRGAWQEENLWKADAPKQPAWIVPPIDHITSGPSGFTYYPGTGFSSEFDNRFFISDFKGGTASISGVRSFRVKQDGARFQMVDKTTTIRGVLTTDVGFGYNGKMYVTDWIRGWNGTGNGRIYALHDPENVDNSNVKEVEKLFRKGFGHRSTEKLKQLLSHPDRRVRLRAQLELARRTEDGLPMLRDTALSSDRDLIPRLHGIWGTGVIARRHDASVLTSLEPLLSSDLSKLRGQTAKVMGEAGFAGATDQLTNLLSDPSKRVRFFAAQALSDLQYDGALDAVWSMIRTNKDRDAYLRHAGVMVLKHADAKALHSVRDNASAAVRRAAMLALRRKQSPRITSFLEDPNVSIAAGAARAIYDLKMDDSKPELASMLNEMDDRIAETYDGKNRDRLHLDAFLRRAMNACLHLRKPKYAQTVARFAANPDVRDTLRIEAIETLKRWSDPAPRERVLGRYRKMDDVPEKKIKPILTEVLPRLLSRSTGKVQKAVTQLASAYDLKANNELFVRMVKDPDRSASARAEALRYLAGRDDENLSGVIDVALNAEAPALRAAARDVLAETAPEKALTALRDVLKNGTTRERQAAFDTLASMDHEGATALLATWLEKLNKGNVDRAVQLDLLNAARASDAEAVNIQLKRYTSNRSTDDPLTEFRVTLAGGDPDRGRTLFRTHNAAQCMRCHAVDGEGGKAGPDLSGIGARKKPSYLLESLIRPNAVIAKGFKLVTVQLKNNRTVAGTVQNETEEKLTVATPAGRIVTLKKKNITSRSTSNTSGMPPMGNVLSKSELRDVIAYLKSLK